MKIHIQPVVERIRFLDDDQEFGDPFLGVATAVHVREGEEVYIEGAHIDGFTQEHLELVYSAMAGKGVKRVTWRHKDWRICVDLETGKMTRTEVEQ